MKKIRVVCLIMALALCGALVWEYVSGGGDREDRIRRFEKRLHDKEREADRRLSRFTDSVSVGRHRWEEDVVFLGFRDGKIFFWTNEVVGMDGLYEQLCSHEHFVELNNVFYEVRKAKYKDIEYYALLHIKDNYPYSNKYIKNRFGEFLGIGIEDADDIRVSPSFTEGGMPVRDKEGNILCYLEYSGNYKDRSVNYVLLLLYMFIFRGIFYVFDLLLGHTGSLKKQLLFIACLILFMMGLRYLMLTWHFPPSLFRLSVFDDNASLEGLSVSIGDLLLSAFCVIQVLGIFFFNIRVDYQSTCLRRLRYPLAVILLAFALAYILFLNHSIRLIIESTGVYLNMAHLVNIGAGSVITFGAILMGGMGLIIIIDGAIAIFKNLFPLPAILLLGTLSLLGPVAVMFLSGEYIDMWGGILVWGIFILVTLNRYMVRQEVQRSVYMLVMLCLSVYVVSVCKKYEQDRELLLRAEYAMELIEERDDNFERKLQEIGGRIRRSEVVARLAAGYNEEYLKIYIANDLLDLNGYNYVPEITLCRAGDRLLQEAGKMCECRGYFDDLIRKYGVKIRETGFYAINDFDGFISYIGAFRFGKVVLYLRFDSTTDSEGNGYPQILSRSSIGGGKFAYPYSFAKYKDGKLVRSFGTFSYYKSLERFGTLRREVKVVEQDDYSHMLIPVGEDGVLVMSLHDKIFSSYYMNVLHAFLVCMLLASYGIFSRRNNSFNFTKGTLRARIKNCILLLIFLLFVPFTVLSICLSMKNFEHRYKAKAMEFLKYVNKELERMDCVEYRKCPGIMDVLVGMSDALQIDINIYSSQGMLVATSRPEIFYAGFEGCLVNAVALERIVRGGSMEYVRKKRIGELGHISVYMPLVLGSGESYILNVPYFPQSDELNVDIFFMLVVALNIVVMIIVLAFVFSGIIAERVTKPLQLVNDKLKAMRVEGKNEKIDYRKKDEVGSLVNDYNEMVEKLEESTNRLAKSERESAWREMARQIAHEVKNPLTPMKLNIQFMLRSLQIEDPDRFKQRFEEISGVLIEQIDNMASIASAFSDFSRISESRNEVFDLSETMMNCVKLFESNVPRWVCDIEAGVRIFADKEQVRRVFVNILKNAEQSIPEEREGEIGVSLKRRGAEVEVRIRDNGTGISPEIRDKVFEPNFTTKNSGTGLGLAISRRIVEHMGGEIGFATSGEGTEFYVILRCEAPSGKCFPAPQW